MRLGCCVLFLAFAVDGFTQCTALDFTSPAQACLNQNLTFVPNTTATSYDWDFCSGDLELAPTVSTLLPATYSNTIAMVQDNGSYYGFYLSGATNSLYRLEFASSLTNTPTAINLGGLGLNINDWHTIKIVKEGSTYYGFFVGNTALYRINFGADIKSTPSDAELIFAEPANSFPIDLSVITEGSAHFIFVVNEGNDTIYRFQCASFGVAPSSFSMDVVPGPSVPSIPTFGGISMMKECNKWYALITSISTDKVYKILFGAGLADAAPNGDRRWAVPAFTSRNCGCR